MAKIHQLRNVLQIVKGVALMAFGLVIVWASLTSSGGGRLAAPLLVALGVGLLTYAIYFAPRVLLDEHGLTAINWATQCHIPWRAYTGVETRFGMVITSADSHGEHRDAVACFPGSGGLARGRERLGRSHGSRPLTPPEARPAGGRTTWVSSRQAAGIIERAAEAATKHAAEAAAGQVAASRAPSPNDRRMRQIIPASAVCLAAGTLCLASGIWLSLP
ncbi:MAG: hypothetical protein Q3979_03755 [Actinomycetaceae bacterium]|nr:hypothetical protein [Actinomycetaceae bacterium]